MIIKNIFKIHPFYYFFALISVLTGNFRSFIIFSIIIVVHEFGHLSMALLFNWKVDKVLLLPFGGVTIFNEDLNRPMIEEALILIGGPLFQIVFVCFFKDNDVLVSYSNILLLFNLLPIYPLDGSKFLNLFLNLFLSFKKSHLFTIYFSFIVMVFVFFKYDFSLMLLIIYLFIFFKVFDELKNHNIIFNRFLLERYTKDFNFKKCKVIKSNNLKKICRDFRHVFLDDGVYVTEREMLKKRFDFKGKTW
ncbi:MAG: hypothetical protein IKF91_04115 [Bacilli bacterium]|nr:hypothetical protein [Bacilli bacterium]